MSDRITVTFTRDTARAMALAARIVRSNEGARAFLESAQEMGISGAPISRLGSGAGILENACAADPPPRFRVEKLGKDTYWVTDTAPPESDSTLTSIAIGDGFTGEGRAQAVADKMNALAEGTT